MICYDQEYTIWYLVILRIILLENCCTTRISDCSPQSSQFSLGPDILYIHYVYIFTVTYGRWVDMGHSACCPSSGYWTRKRHWSSERTQMQQGEQAGGGSNQEDEGQIELVSARETLQPLLFFDLKMNFNRNQSWFVNKNKEERCKDIE